MALSSRPEDFTCVLCEDMFSEPVSTPCGHNFCQSCISLRWRGPGPHQCPVCSETFPTRPSLRINSVIHGMVQRYRQSEGSVYGAPNSVYGAPNSVYGAPNSVYGAPNSVYGAPNSVYGAPNSVYGARTEGSVFGAQAEGSVFGARAEETLYGARSDYSVNGAQSVYSLGTTWSDYGPSKPQASPRLVWCHFCTEPKTLALKFCRDCSTSLCEAHLQPHYAFQELRSHHLQEPGDQHDQVQTVSTDQKPNLRKKDQKPEDPYSGSYTLSSRKVQLRVEKMAQVRAVLERSQREADHKAAEVVKVLHAVVQDVQTSLDQFTQVLEESQTQTQEQAESMVRELQREVKELQEREAGEALVFIHRNSQSPVSLKDWDGVSLAPPPLELRVSEVVSALEERVSERLRSLRLDSDLAHLQGHAVSLTLDPDTAHHRLVLSRGDTAVHYSEEKRKRRNMRSNNDRFRQRCNVMTRQSFTSGTFYFQVQVSGKSDWDVGVARRTVNRKKKVALCPANGFWVLWLRDGTRYQALEVPPVPVVPGHALQTVGVFVDCDVGVVSFYNADTAAPLYSFSDCAFRGAVMPILNPCLSTAMRNSAPLVLTAVQQRPLQERPGGTALKERPGEQGPLLERPGGTALKERPGEQRPLLERPGEQRPRLELKERPGEQRPRLELKEPVYYSFGS